VTLDPSERSLDAIEPNLKEKLEAGANRDWLRSQAASASLPRSPPDVPANVLVFAVDGPLCDNLVQRLVFRETL
jgi:hypothetical protein